VGADSQHLRVQIGVAVARAGDRQCEADHFTSIERAYHLAANLLSYHEHAQGYEFDFGEIPNFPLQGDAGTHIIQGFAFANEG
jgi:hypothetical protein